MDQKTLFSSFADVIYIVDSLDSLNDEIDIINKITKTNLYLQNQCYKMKFSFGVIANKRKTNKLEVNNDNDSDSKKSEEEIFDSENNYYILNLTDSNVNFKNKLNNFILKDEFNSHNLYQTNSITWNKYSEKCIIYICSNDNDDENDKIEHIIKGLLEQNVHLVCLDFSQNSEPNQKILMIKDIYKKMKGKSFTKATINISNKDQNNDKFKFSLKAYIKSLKSIMNKFQLSLNFSSDKVLIDLKQIQKMEKIGQGQFADVFRGKNIENDQQYALKIFKNPICTEEDINLFKREVKIMSQLDHPAILPFIGCSKKDYDDNPNPIIITEYLKNGSLDQIFKKEDQGLSPDEWDDTQKFIAIIGIAKGMKYLISKKILHRDLKACNIFFDQNFYPKIGDFGLSKMFQNKKYLKLSKSGVVGTHGYIAPEIIAGECYSEKSDVYSFGIIVFEILSGKRIIECGKDGPILDNTISESFIKLVNECCSEDPKIRPTFSKINDMLMNDEGFKTDSIELSRIDDYISIFNSVIESNLTDISSSSDNEQVIKKEESSKDSDTDDSEKAESSTYDSENNDSEIEDKKESCVKKTDINSKYKKLKGKINKVISDDDDDEESIRTISIVVPSARPKSRKMKNAKKKKVDDDDDPKIEKRSIKVPHINKQKRENKKLEKDKKTKNDDDDDDGDFDEIMKMKKETKKPSKSLRPTKYKKEKSRSDDDDESHLSFMKKNSLSDSSDDRAVFIKRSKRLDDLLIFSDSDDDIVKKHPAPKRFDFIPKDTYFDYSPKGYKKTNLKDDDTIKKSNINVITATRVCKRNTKVYKPDYFEKNNKINAKFQWQSKIEVKQESSFKILQMVCKNDIHAGILVCASPEGPKEIILMEGEKSHHREITICNQTPLYECLSQDVCQEMYIYNEMNKGCYTDYMIYIPNIPFIKDDNFKPLQPDEVFLADIIASSSPDKSYFIMNEEVDLQKTIETRIVKLIKCAIHNGIKVLVLGSYGCGKSRNDPHVISQIFQNVLVKQKYAEYFTKVYFAIPNKKNFEIFRSYLDNQEWPYYI